MLNTNNPKVKQFIDEINKVIDSKVRDGVRVSETIMNENRLLAVICSRPEASPAYFANKLDEKYGMDTYVPDIIRLIRDLGLNVADERELVFNWAKETTAEFLKVLEKPEIGLDRFNELYSHDPFENFRQDFRYLDKERILLSMLLEMSDELENSINRQKIYLARASIMKYIYIEMINILKKLHKSTIIVEDEADTDLDDTAEIKSEKHRDKKHRDKRKKTSFRDLKDKIEELEGALERTNAMLKDLQDEFDESLQETKILELTDFFAKLNSERYGCILDELMVANKGMAELKKQKYELPIEINGIMIMTKKLIQFVRDNHIEPMMKINELKAVTASDVEFCIYEGTPFMSADEEKLVKVTSPGWIYKDKEIQISRPKVTEVDE